MSDAVKTVGRRLFAKATMGVPLALKNGAVHIAGGGAGVPSTPPPPGMMDAAKMGFVEKVWKAVRTGTKTEQEHGELRWVRRNMMGGLDPDLSVLNSMSLQHRVSIQIDREKEIQVRQRSLRHRIITGLGGKPEDFE